MLLENAAVPVPSFVLVGKATVGLMDVLQQTPFAAIVDSDPTDITSPPLLAVLVVTNVTSAVVTEGRLFIS